MVKSTILLRNEGILPLAKGAKIYSDSNNSNIKEADAVGTGCLRHRCGDHG